MTALDTSPKRHGYVDQQMTDLPGQDALHFEVFN
jgi:hypothetical protein